MLNSNTFICELSKESQNNIKKEIIKFLLNEGYEGEEFDEILENAMNERLWVLEEVINIQPYLERGKVIHI